MSVVPTPFGPLVVTAHADEQYRARIDRFATTADVEAALAGATFRRGAQPPGRVQFASQAAYSCAGWLTTATWACPLVQGHDALVAVTCLRRERKTKALRRELREHAAALAAEEWDAA